MVDTGPEPGAVLELEIGSVAHGGHWVARHDGRVVFVRHAIEGERVRAVVTGSGGGGRFLRADAVEILSPSPHRVTPPCPYAGPGRCGGCDFQHVSLGHQRELKAAVVREQFARLTGMDVDVVVEPVPGDTRGLRWRTRVEFAVDESGRPGLRTYRSHRVVPVADCLIATTPVIASDVLTQRWTGQDAVDVVAPHDAPGAVVVTVPAGLASAPVIHETVEYDGEELRYAVGSRGFWQVHLGAAPAFVGAVMAALGPRPGDSVLDLYAGVGLFSLPVARAVGGVGAVTAVEADGDAARHAATNLAGERQAQVRAERVDRFLSRRARRGRGAARRPDLVVLDPPRSGARRTVVRDIATLGPRRVVYVACDPAALARDTAYFSELGYGLTDLRAFDAFPMTHHVECIATLEPTG